jgi:hypothetical protein
MPKESVIPPSNQQRAPALLPQRRVLLPGLAEDDVDAVLTPDAEHRRRVAAADVDDVVAEEKAPQVGDTAVY